MNDAINCALEYQRRGFSVIPLLDGSDVPPESFNEVASRVNPMTEEEIIEHWSNNPHHNVGVTLGNSPNLEIHKVYQSGSGDNFDSISNISISSLPTVSKENKQLNNNPGIRSSLRSAEVAVNAKNFSDKRTLSQYSTKNHTDVGNANRLVEFIKGNFLYVPQWGKWIYWNGKRWEIDQKGQIMQAAKATIKEIQIEAKEVINENERNELIKHAKRSESEGRLKAMINLAKSEPQIIVSSEMLDTDPWKLNVLNGTICLRTGSLEIHKREDYITKLAPVMYDPNAKSQIFEDTIKRILPDPNVERYVQKALGYSLSGDTGLEKIFFLYGPPATGKSTLLSAVVAISGDYAATADFETFLQRNRSSGGPRNDIARLNGKRLVQSIEVEEGRKLAEAVINQLTGGDLVAARFLYKESEEFRPVCKIWLCANNRPVVSNPDSAIWRRLVQIPFLVEIPEEERDPGLKAKLLSSEKNASAILNWLLQGCMLLQKEGLAEPDSVKQLTNEYRKESDTLSEFIQDCCGVVSTAEVLNKELWAAYVIWCNTNFIEHRLGRNKFMRALESRGFKKKRQSGSGQNIWIGIGLLSKDSIL